MSSKAIPIIINLEDNIISGYITLFSELRLSDYLNSEVKFLVLTNVIITKIDGTKERTDEVHVNKESIRMIQTVRGDAAQGIGCKSGERRYPYVPKKSVRARFHMSDFEVDGNLHCNDENAIAQLLEQSHCFLPCTGAKIRDVHSNAEWKTDFAAVNRKQVAMLQKIAEESPSCE
jgi:hypothetical protein